MGELKEMISTRLDKDSLAMLAFIEEKSHCASRSDAVKKAINMAYEKLKGPRKSLKQTLEDSGFIGCGKSGINDISSNHKKYLSESLNQKWS
jgi:hypothetical protein